MRRLLAALGAVAFLSVWTGYVWGLASMAWAATQTAGLSFVPMGLMYGGAILAGLMAALLGLREALR